MQIAVIQRVIGILLMLFSTTMLPPLLVSLIGGDGNQSPFIITLALTFFTGLIAWFPVHNRKEDLRLRDGFLIVVLFWTVLGLFGALPFYLDIIQPLSITDAVFESVSGLTTTGATVFPHIDGLPVSILYYRQQLQWLGGMGIIVLAVAILPMLGIGGMQLYRAETPGPMKDSKLTPRITETAKALWYIYLGLTVLCAISYWLAGMDIFDAISHSFSTVAIGGFSTHDASLGYYVDQPMVEVVATIFMLLAGANFALHYLAWRRVSLESYRLDEEFLTYLKVFLIIGAVTVLYLIYTDFFLSWDEAVRHGIFQAVSIGTTTGFTTVNYNHWPALLPVMLLFASFIGGCAGSTGGGMKVIRFLLLLKQGAREISKLIHPNAIFPIKIGGKPVKERVINSVWGFFATYVAIFAIMMLVLMMTGIDQVTAFSAIAASLNNLGPGLGDVSAHYANVGDVAKWVLCFAMLLGRLEIFTLLVLLTPAFWRK
ncbi:MAG: TrkH family potassium uptake protein [Gammaproteobacteria bacterium]|nr:TrkH family potassium uptake protein [Gammaproteobacteria bacterium]